MMRYTSRLTAILVFFSIMALSNQSRAMMASEITSLRVIGYHFTTRVSCDKNVFSSKDPSDTRIVIFKFAAKVPDGNGVLFIDDFLLRYYHDDNREDRSSAVRICSAETSVIGEENNCLASRSGWINIGTGDVLFTVSFFLENDVRQVELFRAGGSEGLLYSISPERPYSVFISTNQSRDLIAGIVEVIESGGYRILRTSGELDPENEGITVFYTSSAEIQAREISQRIMTKTGVAPVFKENNFINGDSDIVVWIGK